MGTSVQFPPGIWLKVMSYLDYQDLKTCMDVSKTHQALTEHATFDRTLFRSKQVVTVSKPFRAADVRLNPLFQHMMYECTGDIEDVEFYNWDGNYEPDRLMDSDEAEEHATDPAVDELRVRVHDWRPVVIKNKRGVTVLEVMEALCRFFKKENHRDSLGDHTGWTGWDEVCLDYKGRLLLCADWFDS